MSLFVASHVRSLHQASNGKLSLLGRSSRASRPKKPDRPLGTSLTALFESLAVSSPQSNTGESNPTTAECATHLELLEVFLQLRLKILQSTDLDTAFGIKENRKTVYRKQASYQYGRRKYTNKPVQLRDTTWQTRRREKWPYYLSIAVERFRVWAAKTEETLANSQAPDALALPIECLPPVDILMVWHAFLLNPRDFATHCQNEKLLHLRQVPFPWSDIHAAIDTQILTYTLPPSAVSHLESTFSIHPDLITYLTSPKHDPSETTALQNFSSKPGANTPLPSISTITTPLEPPSTNLTVLLSAHTHHTAPINPLITLVSQSLPSSSKNPHRKMISNIQRQTTFIDKMHSHLWLRSPALLGTLRRAIDRYDKFVRLFGLYPGKMLVPTLDIDLVWHTHQLYAGGYESAMRQRTGRFVDHDDKLRGNVLKGGMEETRELWWVNYGAGYEVCGCWDCEALAECLEEGEGEEGGEEEMEGVVERARQNVEYCRAAELARRRAYPVR